MDLRRLQSFVAVAETLNFRRAAERVAITQPALSQQIRELERDLGAELFRRDKRNVELTEAGVALLSPARQMLDLAARTAETVRALGKKPAMTLRLGYVEYMNLPFLIPVLRALRDRQPTISIEHKEMYSAAVIQALAERQIDLGFAFRPITHPDLSFRPVLEGCWTVILPSTHPLAENQAVAVADLARERIVLWARHLNPPLYDALVRSLSQNGETLNIAYHTAQAQMGPRLVLEGIGLFVVASYISPHLPPGLVVRPLGGFDNRLELAAVWRGDGRTLAVKEFLDILGEELGHGKRGKSQL